jgi:hypothetical protein
MNNNDWEERLQDGPYVVSPNHIQIKSIQERVHSVEKKRVRSGLKRMVSFTLIFAIIACFWIFKTHFPTHHDNVASDLSNNDILQKINQIHPDSDREILYKENVGNSGLLIFTKKINAVRQGMTWEVGYINGLSQSWISGGETWIDFVSQTQYEKGIKEGFKNLIPMYISAKEGSPYPILYGALVDPQVTQIRISGENNFQQTAKIISHVHGGFSLWFTFLPDTKMAFKVEYMDKKGKVIMMHLAN